MGLFTYTLAGGGFVVVGALESVCSTSEFQNVVLPSPSSPPASFPAQPSSSSPRSQTTSFLSFVTFAAIAALSIFYISNSLISLTDALNSKDSTGVVLQLEVISISLVFLLYAFVGILTFSNNSLHFPSSILNLLCLFGFVEEFFLFYLQRKDPSGIENRYFDLLLVPIAVCVFSAILELKNPRLRLSRLGRGIGLILQGMWFVQMGFSFYSNLVVHGCFLHEKSRGNFTIRCKGHPEYHRGRAIATLQFNCHLALLVTLIVGVYSVICRKHWGRGELMRYKPLGEEMHQFDTQARFTLDSDEDENDDEGNHSGIKEEGNVVSQKASAVVLESGVNGFGSHH